MKNVKLEEVKARSWIVSTIRTFLEILLFFFCFYPSFLQFPFSFFLQVFSFWFLLFNFMDLCIFLTTSINISFIKCKFPTSQKICFDLKGRDHKRRQRKMEKNKTDQDWILILKFWNSIIKFGFELSFDDCY